MVKMLLRSLKLIMISMSLSSLLLIGCATPNPQPTPTSGLQPGYVMIQASELHRLMINAEQCKQQLNDCLSKLPAK